MAYFVKEDNGDFNYSYYDVCDTIPGEYVKPNDIEAYIENEAFEMAVKASYKNIDISGRSKRDLERFNAKRERVAAWLRDKANARYF
jgi:hypothetical protein